MKPAGGKPGLTHAGWEGWTIVVAAALRVILAALGGQRYWPDESRYTAAKEAVARFAEGHWRAGWGVLIGKADHLFFKIAGLPAAWAELKFGPHPIWPAWYFGAFSVLAIWLVGRVARAAGAGEREAGLAVFFAAASTSLLYYSRHYFPYDLALAFCLCALWRSLRERGGGGYLAGFAAGLGFLTYNGYWVLGGAILAWHVLRAPSWRMKLFRALTAGLGLATPIATVIMAAHGLGFDLIRSFREFSGTIGQGDFGGGYALVPAYLWASEGGLLVLWLALVAWGWGQTRAPDRARWWIWLGFAAALYTSLVLCADVLKIFVVYGRIARIVVPFLCLAAAWSTERILIGARHARRTTGLLAAATVTLAAVQMAAPFRQAFPLDFRTRAGPVLAASQRDGLQVVRLMNTRHLGPNELIAGERRPHTVLLRSLHPLQYRPYLFEGFDAEQRAYLESHDIAMQVIALSNVPVRGNGYGRYPGPLRLRLRFPTGRAGYAEPLLTGGPAGEANFVYVRYLDDGHLQVGYDSWGGGAAVGPAIPVDLAKEHDVVIYAGFQLPPGPSAWPQEERALLRRLRRYVLVTIDGQTALAQQVRYNVVPPDSLFVGLNAAGGSSTGEDFTGEILAIDRITAREMAPPLLAKFPMIFREEPEWQDYIGPVRLSLTLPESKPAGNEPLVITGRAGAGDLLFLHYESDGSARVGWDHWGAETTLSPSFPIPENRRIELVVSMGSLLPPDGSPLYAANPDFALLRNRLEVDLGDRPLLSRSADFYPCAADDVTFGANLIGGSTVAMTFAGTVDRIGLEAATEIVGRLATSQVAAASPGPRWEGYPGPVRIRLTFPQRPAAAREPLLVTGATGGGDFVFVHYAEGGRIRLGFDHWGAGGPESGEFAPGGEGPGILLVSHGGLMPPPDAPLYREHPELLTLRDWLVVAYNGQPILVQRVPHHPSLPAQITAGSNRIGGSSTGARFSGDIFMIGSAPAEAVRALISAAEERGRAP